MAIQIGDEPERVSLAEKLAPWLRRFIIGGAPVWICCSMQNFYEDARSHTIKVVYPLLMSREKITALQPGYDPQRAVWKPVSSAFPVTDGAILFVKKGDAVYAVKMGQQTIRPERAGYTWIQVGSAGASMSGTAETSPGGIDLPGCHLDWSGQRDGAGFLYLNDAFVRGQPPPYAIGVPFQSGELEQYRRAVPAGVHFESVPWKVIP